MGKMQRYITGAFVGGAGVLAPVLAMAEGAGFTITPPEFDYATLGTYAGTILTALAAIWLVRKFIKITNRS